MLWGRGSFVLISEVLWADCMLLSLWNLHSPKESGHLHSSLCFYKTCPLQEAQTASMRERVKWEKGSRGWGLVGRETEHLGIWVQPQHYPHQVWCCPFVIPALRNEGRRARNSKSSSVTQRVQGQPGTYKNLSQKGKRENVHHIPKSYAMNGGKKGLKVAGL